MPSSGYATISFTAGEQPTTAKWNLVGSNDASFNNGNGFNDGILVPRHFSSTAVNSSVVDWTTAGGIWWQELGRATASVAGTTITISSIPARTYLRILVNLLPTAATSTVKLIFNGDSGTNYGYRLSTNGSADSTGTFAGLPIDTAASPASVMWVELEGNNNASKAKLFVGHSIDENCNRRELNALWSNTSAQINSIALNTSVNMAVGSEIIVLGHN